MFYGVLWLSVWRKFIWALSKNHAFYWQKLVDRMGQDRVKIGPRWGQDRANLGQDRANLGQHRANLAEDRVNIAAT